MKETVYKETPMKKILSFVIGTPQQSKKLTFLMAQYFVVASSGLFIWIFTSAYFHPSKAVTVFVDKFGEGYSEMYFLIPALFMAIIISLVFVHKSVRGNI